MSYLDTQPPAAVASARPPHDPAITPTASADEAGGRGNHFTPLRAPRLPLCMQRGAEAHEGWLVQTVRVHPRTGYRSYQHGTIYRTRAEAEESARQVAGCDEVHVIRVSTYFPGAGSQQPLYSVGTFDPDPLADRVERVGRLIDGTQAAILGAAFASAVFGGLWLLLDRIIAGGVAMAYGVLP